ncbi:MAG TPA: phosphoribosylanthranilate isomerase [Gemmatimonadales bacterium]|nr:phosphoribosylanthranilate isomerase [Gemmatimonadales bacterium]
MGVEVKVCGLMQSGDAVVAVEAGASYLGVVFAGGPRQVSVPEARAIVAAAEGRPVIGVFGAHSAGEILALRRQVGLSGAQLHGGFDPETAARLRAEGMGVWGVVRLRREEETTALAAIAAAVDAVLVEPRVEGMCGGTGIPLDHALARAARQALAGHRMVLAGGLRPDTVSAAIAAVKPDIVDVSSGIETAPGRKDPARVRLFLEAVRGDQPSP